MATVIVSPWCLESTCRLWLSLQIDTSNIALKVFSLILFQIHSWPAPCDLLKHQVRKLEHQLHLLTGSQLFPRQVPWPLLRSRSSWLTSCKAQSLHQKDTGRPLRDPETWVWVPSCKMEEMCSAAFRQKRGLNPAHRTLWARTLTLGRKLFSILSSGRKAQKMLIFSAGPDQGGWGKPTLQISAGFSYGLDAAKP